MNLLPKKHARSLVLKGIPTTVQHQLTLNLQTEEDLCYAEYDPRTSGILITICSPVLNITGQGLKEAACKWLDLPLHLFTAQKMKRVIVEGGSANADPIPNQPPHLADRVLKAPLPEGLPRLVGSALPSRRA